MKTIITGASGFVGVNMVRYFQAKGLGPVPLSLRGDWQSQMPMDADAVVHLAGKAHDTANTSDDRAYFEVNTELTKQVFDRFLESPTARDFIYFSSVKAAADTVEGVLEEEVVADPRTAYGRSKLQAEEYLLSQLLPVGKRVIIFRPCMIHGPGNKGNLNLLFQVVRRGIPWPLAAFDNRRSFLSVKNLLYITEQFLRKPELPGGIYNLADDEVLSTNELVTLIAESTARKPRLWSLSPALIKSAARLGDFVPIPLNTERLKKLTETYIVSNQKVKTTLGIDGLPVSAKDGLRETIKSF